MYYNQLLSFYTKVTLCAIDCKRVWGFSTSRRVGIPKQALVKGQLYDKVLFACYDEGSFLLLTCEMKAI